MLNLPQGARHAGVLRRAVSADLQSGACGQDLQLLLPQRHRLPLRQKARHLTPRLHAAHGGEKPLLPYGGGHAGRPCGAADHPGRSVPPAHQRTAHRPFRAGRPENHRKTWTAGVYPPPPHPPRSRGKRSVCGAAFSL